MNDKRRASKQETRSEENARTFVAAEVEGGDGAVALDEVGEGLEDLLVALGLGGEVDVVGEVQVLSEIRMKRINDESGNTILFGTGEKVKNNEFWG